jgi:hypothetical protein
MEDNGEDTICPRIPSLALKSDDDELSVLGVSHYGWSIKRWEKKPCKSGSGFFISPEPDLPFFTFSKLSYQNKN